MNLRLHKWQAKRKINMQKFYVTPQDIEIIQKVIKENEIQSAFELIHESHGIGSTLHLEFGTDLHGRQVVVRVEIAGSENW